MQSKTLSSNLTLLRKDLTRFSPLWLTYSASLLIYGYLVYLTQHDLTASADTTIQTFVVINLFYGIAVAATLFGYLFEPKECVMVHGLPLRREHLFAVHLVCGFAMQLIPSAVFFAGVSPLCQTSVLPLLGFSLMQYLFFFAIGIFCVMLTGRRMAAAAMYTLLNFGSTFAFYAASTLYLPLMPGVELNWDGFLRFCPPASMSMSKVELLGSYGGYTKHLALFALAAAALLGLSLLLYRRRKLERAENFMAFPGLNFLFVVSCSVFCGCFFISFFSLFTWESSHGLHYWIPMVLGVVMGYFGAAMLLHRSPRVFGGRSLVGFALLAAVLAGSLFVTKMDIFHTVNYVPQPDQITRFAVNGYGREERWFDADPQICQRLTDLHRMALSQLDEEPEIHDEDEYVPSMSMELDYQLTDGRTIRRSYTAQGAVLQELYWFLSQPEYLMGTGDLETLIQICEECTIDIYYPDGSRNESVLELNEAQRSAFLPLLFQDAEAGNLYDRCELDATQDQAEPMYSVSMAQRPIHGEEYPNYFYFEIPQTAGNSLAWIHKNVELSA